MTKSQSLKILATATLVTLLLANSGCVGFTTWLMYVWGGDKIKAEFDELEKKRVAVICVSPSSYDQSPAKSVERLISSTLQREVKGIDVVRQHEISEWIDNNELNYGDYAEVGRAVDADMVVVVQMTSYRLTKGRTLFQGHANLTLSVLDISKSGRIVFEKDMPSFEWPAHGPKPQADTTRARFEGNFLKMISDRISHCFYDVEFPDTVSRDSYGTNNY